MKESLPRRLKSKGRLLWGEGCGESTCVQQLKRNPSQVGWWANKEHIQSRWAKTVREWTSAASQESPRRILCASTLLRPLKMLIKWIRLLNRTLSHSPGRLQAAGRQGLSHPNSCGPNTMWSILWLKILCLGAKHGQCSKFFLNEGSSWYVR